MIMTPQHFASNALTDKLLEAPPELVLNHYPWINYVVVRPIDSLLRSRLCERPRRSLRAHLLCQDKFDESFTMLGEINYQQADGRAYVLARAFRIERAARPTNPENTR